MRQLGLDPFSTYDVNLHYAPPSAKGKKALDLLGGNGQSRCGVVARQILLRPARVSECCCLGRYFIRASQPIYGWWFYYMWYKVIGPVLNTNHPLAKLNVRTPAAVAELLAFEIRV